jgi:hypothetical protein
VLANGTFILSRECRNCLSRNPILFTADALFNATGLNWHVIPGRGKNDPNEEEGWTLEPSGQLLTVDTWLTPTTELFTPKRLTYAQLGIGLDRARRGFVDPVHYPENGTGRGEHPRRGRERDRLIASTGDDPLRPATFAGCRPGCRTQPVMAGLCGRGCCPGRGLALLVWSCRAAVTVW